MILGSREDIHTGRLLLVLFDSLRLRSRSVPLTNVVTYCMFEKFLQHLLKIFMSSSERLADRFYVRARQPRYKFAKTRWIWINYTHTHCICIVHVPNFVGEVRIKCKTHKRLLRISRRNLEVATGKMEKQERQKWLKQRSWDAADINEKESNAITRNQISIVTLNV